MYHSLDLSGSVVSVRPQLFAEQMKALATAGHRGMSLREAVAFRAQRGHWPEKAAVLTFDDGFVNNVEFGLPVLQCYGFTATLFAISGFVGRRNEWGPPPARLGPQRLASWDQLKTWCDAGNEVGAHTRTHRDLRRVPSDEQHREIVGSRDEIASRLGVTVDSFAYPYGGVSAAAALHVRDGFRAACTTRMARAGKGSPHNLPRLDAYYFSSAASLARAARGLADRYIAVRRWGRAVRGIVRPAKAAPPVKK